MGAMCAYVSVCLPVCMHMCVCVCVCIGGLGECHRESDLDATHTLRTTLTGCIIESGLVCECVSEYVCDSLNWFILLAQKRPFMLFFVIFLRLKRLGIFIYFLLLQTNNIM